ncbi:MAG TPA: hypothetical protein VF006_31600 [Longimicrobium sp.]
MRKLRLDPDSLEVQSFPTLAPEGAARGTVHGGQAGPDTPYCNSFDAACKVTEQPSCDGTCQGETCYDSCDLTCHTCIPSCYGSCIASCNSCQVTCGSTCPWCINPPDTEI